MTFQPRNDDACPQPSERIHRAAIPGIRGGPIFPPGNRLRARDCRLPVHAHPDYLPRHAPRETSSYTSEHMRMKPVMDVVRKSQDCKPISAGFAIQQEDKTIAEITWRWNHATEKIIGLNARLITKLSNHQRLLVNRTIIGIFSQAHMSMPEILYKHQSS
jgi:hypothetical protein